MIKRRPNNILKSLRGVAANWVLVPVEVVAKTSSGRHRPTPETGSRPVRKTIQNESQKKKRGVTETQEGEEKNDHLAI